METVVKDMQHPSSGVPVKSQKLFLTTITNAFTGILSHFVYYWIDSTGL